jgi:NADH-quinone oxidoreductase subunit N
MNISLASILPVAALSVFGVAIMMLGPFTQKGRPHRMNLLAFAGVIAAILAMMPMMDSARGAWYSGSWIVDEFSVFFHVVFLLIAALTTLSAMDYLRRENMDHPEFYALLLFATAGMLTMAASQDLIVIFIGLEVLSIATYVMAGFRRSDLKSNESALKYFLLGSFASAFFLYGIALIFGATGSTNLKAIEEGISQIALAGTGAGSNVSLLLLAASMMLIALCFKVALAPFHVWTPDVYEGAPTPVTGFMSVGPKAAGFAVLLRILITAFPALQSKWQLVIAVIAGITMVFGNIVALVQPNIKRMLAYSSIAHAGYVAVGLAAAAAAQTNNAVSAALFYLLAYAATNLGAFAIVAALGRSEDKLTYVSDYAGLARKRPGLAALLSLFLLSLAGVPGTAGFTAKFFIFRAAVDSGLYYLAIIGALTTVVSFYFYLYIIVQMYMRDPREEFTDVRVPASGRLMLATAALATVYLGLWPGGILAWSLEAAKSLR